MGARGAHLAWGAVVAGVALGIGGVLGSDGRADATHLGSCWVVTDPESGDGFDNTAAWPDQATCESNGGQWTAGPADTTTTTLAATTTLAPTTTLAATTTLAPTTTEAPTTTAAPTTTTMAPVPPAGYVVTDVDAQVTGATLGLALGVIVGGTVFANTWKDDGT